ncbi:hypothetical protein LDO31_14795 [Luteimonas sp. XNQY3]|nr:hypothetical protein [Luteimonas sp. XNQY3]MCD9007485.1 hypothetical protein [Luteimonas sp. XNQY3]
MTAAPSRWRRLFTRATARRLMWIAVLLAAAIAANVVGIRIAGSLDGWRQWMEEHAGFFLVWRLLLYGATAYGWWWMRQRLRAREPDGVAHRRLVRVEVAAVVVLVALEGSLLLQAA